MLNDIHVPPLSEDERNQGCKVGHEDGKGHHAHGERPPLHLHPKEVLAGHREPIDADLTAYDFNTAYLVAILAASVGVIGLVVLWIFFV